MRDTFDVIAQTMRKIVHWIDAPRVASVMMFGVANAIEDRITHPDVRRGHVDFRTERPRPIGEFAILHSREQVEILFDRAISKRTFLAGPVWRAAIFVGVLRRKIIDVSESLLRQLDGVF